MAKRSVILATVAAMAICVAQAATSEARAQGQAPAALTGQVSSQAEGAMEGVVVSAKKAGSTITISVVSDKDGRYAFPASKLEPGQYALKIRAVGYVLDGAGTAQVAAGTTSTADLKLKKTKNLPAQLTSFIGRGRETAEVMQLLETRRLLTLTGPPGTGKTRLGLRVAAEVVDQFGTASFSLIWHPSETRDSWPPRLPRCWV